MKILFTGGGSGGHFYPIIAIAEELNNIIEKEKFVGTELVFMSPEPYDAELLREKGIRFKRASAGKLRRYFSFLYIIDFIKTTFGILKTIASLYFDFPDVVFSKGGYASFPTLVAARFFRIPIIIHESDIVPGKVNRWSSKFAKRIAVSYPETIQYFPEKVRDKIEITGYPVRRTLLSLKAEGAKEFLKLEAITPIILILGGSQGAKKISDTVVDIADKLVEKYQIIHQSGKKNLQDVENRISTILGKSSLRSRYHTFGFLKEDSMRMAATVADLIISRAGSTIFEIAAWGKPSILIPLKDAAQDHQRENAYSFAKTGATNVIEEKNLTPHILLSEINRIFADKDKMAMMGEKAKTFAKPDAAFKIAQEIINLALEHA